MNNKGKYCYLIGQIKDFLKFIIVFLFLFFYAGG